MKGFSVLAKGIPLSKERTYSIVIDKTLHKRLLDLKHQTGLPLTYLVGKGLSDWLETLTIIKEKVAD